jgi:hypothetical protein
LSLVVLGRQAAAGNSQGEKLEGAVWKAQEHFPAADFHTAGSKGSLWELEVGSWELGIDTVKSGRL